MRNVSLIVIVLLAATANARAESVALLPAQGINVEDGTLQAARDMLQGDLARLGRTVILAGDPAAQPISPEQALRAGADARTDFAALLHLTRLGSTTRARLTVYRVPSGETTYAGDMTASSTDDLAGVLDRLAIAFASHSSTGQTAQLGNLTEAEAAPPIVHSVRMRAGASVMGLAAFNRPAGSSSAAAAGASAFIYFDAEFLLWDGFIDLMGHGNNVVFDAGVGVYYPLSAAAISPYVGGALRWSAAKYGGAGASGVSPEATFGLVVGRTSSSQLRVQASYFFDLFAEGPDATTTTGTTGSGSYVNGLIFSLGFCTRP